MSSLALEPPKGHTSSSFLALPREVTKPTPQLHPLLLALLRKQTSHAVIFLPQCFSTDPWNLPKATFSLTPIHFGPHLQKAKGTPQERSIRPPSLSDGAKGATSLNQGP